MNHIVNMTFLGVIAAMIAIFWTRIIRKGMILERIGNRIANLNNESMIMTQRPSKLAKFLVCMFCIAPWLCLVLDIFYVIYYLPGFFFVVIGILGGVGAGCFTCELAHTLRDED